MTSGAVRSTPSLLDTSAVFAVCLVAYALLAQRTMYGVDAWNDLRQLAGGDTRSAIHLLYKPLAGFAASIGDALGVSLHASVRALSVVGAASGVALAHAASRVLGADRRIALAVAALAGAAPGVVFYATVVERHGPFFGFAGLACWACARAGRAGSWAWGVGLGLALALAYAAHSTGVLLVSVLLPLVAVFSREHGRSWLAPTAITTVAATPGSWAVSELGIAVGHTTRAGGNFEILLEYAELALEHPENLVPCSYHEFALPLMPLSLLWLAAWFRPELRWHAAACACGVVVHVAFAFVILGGFDLAGGFTERGAYVLGLAWPLAHLIVRAVPRPAVWIGAALAAGIGVSQVVAHDERPDAETSVRLRALADGAEPVLLPACRPDFELLFTEFPDLRPLEGWFDLFNAAHEQQLEPGLGVAAALPDLLAAHAAAGRPVLLSEAGEAYLRQPLRPPHPEIGPAILEALLARFELVAVPGTAWRRLNPR